MKYLKFLLPIALLTFACGYWVVAGIRQTDDMFKGAVRVCLIRSAYGYPSNLQDYLSSMVKGRLDEIPLGLVDGDSPSQFVLVSYNDGTAKSRQLSPLWQIQSRKENWCADFKDVVIHAGLFTREISAKKQEFYKLKN